MRVNRYTKTVIQPRAIPNMVDEGAIRDAGATFQAISQGADMAAQYVEKERQAVNATKVNNSVISYKKDLLDASETFRQENMATPEDASKRFEDVSRKISQQYADSLQDEEAKQAFQSTVKNVDLGIYESNLNWERQRNVTLSAERVEDAANKINTIAYRYGQTGQPIDDVRRDIEATVIAESTFLAPEAIANSIETMEKGAVTNYMQARLDADATNEVKRMLDSGEYDDILGAEGLQKGYKAIEVRRKALQAEARAEMTPVINDAIAEARFKGETSIMPDREQINNLYGEDKGEKVWQEYEDAVEFGKKYSSIAMSSPDEIRDMFSKQTAEGEGFVQESKDIQALTAAYFERQKKIQADPNAYIQSSFPEVAQAYEAYNEDPTPENLQYAISLANERQEFLGIPEYSRRIQSKPQTADQVKQLMMLNPQERLNQVSKIKQMYGEYFPSLYTEMVDAGLSSNMAVALRMDKPEQQRAAGLLMEADNQAEQIAKMIDSSDKTEINDALAAEMGDFEQSIAAQPGNIEEGLRTRTAVTTLAQKYRLEGLNPSEAATKAYDDIIESQYNFVENVRVPVDFDADLVDEGLNEFLSNRIDKYHNVVLPEDTVSINGTPDEITQELYREELKYKGQFITNRKGDGVILVDQLGYPVLEEVDGELRMIEQKFKHIEVYGRFRKSKTKESAKTLKKSYFLD